MTESLRALALVCTLKAAPEPSSSEVIARQILDTLGERGVACDLLRVVDFDVRPGVEKDMGGPDKWPMVRQHVLDSDILVLSTPTWVGHLSSVAQRVLERLDAELSETDDDGRPLMFGKVATVSVVGNEDGAHKVIADSMQALNDIGFTLPAQGATYWNAEAMNPRDYKDLEETPEALASTNETMAANAVHLARLLKARQYPATS